MPDSEGQHLDSSVKELQMVRSMLMDLTVLVGLLTSMVAAQANVSDLRVKQLDQDHLHGESLMEE